MKLKEIYTLQTLAFYGFDVEMEKDSRFKAVKATKGDLVIFASDCVLKQTVRDKNKHMCGFAFILPYDRRIVDIKHLFEES